MANISSIQLFILSLVIISVSANAVHLCRGPYSVTKRSASKLMANTISNTCGDITDIELPREQPNDAHYDFVERRFG